MEDDYKLAIMGYSKAEKAGAKGSEETSEFVGLLIETCGDVRGKPKGAISKVSGEFFDWVFGLCWGIPV